MKIAIRGGHNYQATGSAALLNEVEENRILTPIIIKYLKKLGHEVLDVTPGNCDVDSDLNYGVSKANNWGADLFVSIHLNKAYASYNGAIGSEVCVYSNIEEAQRVCNKLGALGFINRGQKIRPDLYELKYTTMKAMIIEVCFVEATKDVELYKRLGHDRIAKAIAEGIANKNIESTATNELYRVRKTWIDAASQKGAYSNLDNAKAECNKHAGYSVYDNKGKVVYTNAAKTIAVGSRVKITGSNYATGQVIPSWVKNNVYTVQQISGPKVLIKEITSWVYINDLVIV